MFNKVIFLGNLTKNVEVKYSSNGTAVGTSSIASNYKYKSNTGEQKDETCFLDFTLFGRSAEVANQYLKKGSKVLLEGRLVLETWAGQDGKQRSKHSLRVDNMKMLGGKEEQFEQTDVYPNQVIQQNQSNAQQEENSINRFKNAASAFDINNEDIPF